MPGATPPVPAGTTPPVVTPPAGTTPPATPPGGAGTTPPATPPVRDIPTPPPAAPGTPPPQGTPAQIIVTTPGQLQVAGGPYTVPISINNASRLSVITLTVTYNPRILRVRTVQDGLFMRQGGVTASFTPRMDAANGRVDIALARVADQTGAMGAGLLAALLVDAIGPGTTTITVTGVGTAPDNSSVLLSFSPVTVTVR
jgi:hypothetical protein